MKILFSCILILLILGCDKRTGYPPHSPIEVTTIQEKDEIPPLGEFEGEIKLLMEQPLESLPFEKSSFSFFHLDQTTRESFNFDLFAVRFQGFDTNNPEDKDRFVVQSGYHFFSKIIDLGNTNCKEAEPLSPEEAETRIEAPNKWYFFSKTWEALQDSKNNYVLPIISGHCYALASIGLNHRVDAMFRVKEYKKGLFVIIHQIEVFNRKLIIDKNLSPSEDQK